jgi:hypothetical protein
MYEDLKATIATDEESKKITAAKDNNILKSKNSLSSIT